MTLASDGLAIGGELILTGTDATYPRDSVALYAWQVKNFGCDFIATTPI
jgi:hypothetical protein